MTEIIDMQAVRELKELMEQKFPALVQTYVESSRKHVDDVIKGVDADDAALVESAAHPLKSSSANMGLMALYELSRDIEDVAERAKNSSGNLQDCADMVERLGGLYLESLRALQSV